MDELLPWLNRRKSSLVDIKNTSEQNIPDKPGVYILLGNTQYPYPWSKKNGKSRVFYIG